MTQFKDESMAYVKVMDRSGKEYVCPSNAVENLDDVTKEDLRSCLDSDEEAFNDAEVRAIIKSDLHKL